MRKKFVIYYKPEPEWSTGGERVQLVEGMDFFTLENGFSIYDIDEVGNLRYDGTLNIGPLMVWRVK